MVWWGSIGGRWLAGLDDLGGLFQPWWCYDSVIYSWSCLVWVDWHSSSDLSQQVLQAFFFCHFVYGDQKMSYDLCFSIFLDATLWALFLLWESSPPVSQHCVLWLGEALQPFPQHAQPFTAGPCKTPRTASPWEGAVRFQCSSTSWKSHPVFISRRKIRTIFFGEMVKAETSSATLF